MSRSRTIVSLFVAAALGAVLAAAGSLAIDRLRWPDPRLHERDFHFERADHTPLEITPQRPLILPYAFADHDLSAEFELAEGAELDLVHRLVEPVMREHGLVPFHARFGLFRISTRDGAAVRTRETALFLDDVAADVRGGVPVSPGLPATVTLRARGRETEAVIAGRRLPMVTTDDAHGQIAVLVRGGRALMHRLEILARPRPLALLPVGYAAIGGGLVGLLASLLGQRRTTVPVRARRGLCLLLVLLLLPLVAIGMALAIWSRGLPECEPSPLALVLSALAGGPLVLGLAWRRDWIGLVVGAVVSAPMIATAIGVEWPRLSESVDPRLSQYFGVDSGSAPFDALARRMSARDAVHGVDAAGERIVFLGGSALFESHPDRAYWIAPIASARAGQLLPGRKFDGAVFPWASTEGSVVQQIECFERFYAVPMASRAIVIVVPEWESEVGDAKALADQIDAFVVRSESRGCQVLVGVDAALDAEFIAALREQSTRRHQPLLVVSPVEDPSATIEAIAAALAERLR